MKKSILKRTRNQWTAAALAFLMFFLMETNVSADDANVIPFPELPKGAGKIDADASKTFTVTKSGLKYRILRTSDGAKARAVDTVKVNYHGWIPNGKVFDSSYVRNSPISFPLNQVIAGWTEGMQLVGQGGMIELLIPSGLAYGDRGAPPAIPPKATLSFLVELIQIQ